MKNIRVHKGDLPDLSNYNVDAIAVDTETMGLHFGRDRLCVVQLSPGNGTVDIVQVAPDDVPAPNLISLFENSDIVKIFHYARFDLGAIANHSRLLEH